jgi:DNA polymerase elongation subunit (family B)
MSFPRKKVKWSTSKDLEFLSIDWIECDETEEREYQDYDTYQQSKENDENENNNTHKKTYTIFAFGVTTEGYSVCAKITNYNPYFYIKIPDLLLKNPKLKDKFEREFFNKDILNWGKVNKYNKIENENDEGYISPTSTNKKAYLKQVRTKIGNSENKSALLNQEIHHIKREIFWSFTNNTKYDFWKLSFQSKEGFHLFNAFFKINKHFPNMIDKSAKSEISKYYNLHFKLFESELEPLLRFFHDSKVKPSNWIKFEKNTYKNKSKMSSCQINVEVNWTKVIPIDKDEISPLIVASYDIEADSSHGDFPLAKKDYKKLANELVISYLNKKKSLSKLTKGSDEYKELYDELKSTTFFKQRIIQAFDLNKKYYTKKEPLIDDSISKVYFKQRNIKSTKDNKYIIELYLSSDKCNELCDKLLFICDRDIKKIRANTKMKAVITTINIRYERLEEYRFKKYKNNKTVMKKCSIHDLISIIQSESERNDDMTFDDLKHKIFIKDIIVKYVNQELTHAFPQVKGDKVIQIGTTFWRYGDDKPIYNNMITLKNCDDIPNIDIYSFEKESDVLLEWTKMIRHYDPDIILGYNIFGFDEVFMYDRVNELIANGNQNNPKYQQFINMGRLNSDTYKNIWNCKGKLLKKKLASSALGANYLEYFNMPGRVQIDLLKSIQGGLTKLDSYKLDNVAEFYICGNITKIGKDGDEFINESEWLTVTNINELELKNYLVISLKTGEKVLNGKKLIIEEIDIDNNMIKVSDKISTNILGQAPKWGLAKDDVTPQQIFEFQNGTDEQRAIIAKYCIQDCVLVVRLLKKLDTIVNNFGMSNVCLVPFSYIFMRGQGIKIFSLIVDECSTNDYLLPMLEKVYREDECENGDDLIDVENVNNDSILNLVNNDNFNSDETTNDDFSLGNNFNKIIINGDGYEGAIVLEPQPGIYIKDPITVLDFSSLYPSEIIASNLSHDSHCEDPYWLGEKGAERIKELGYEFLDIEYDIYSWIDQTKKNKGKEKTGKTIERFIQYSDGKKGLIPNIEMKLLGARKATKKKMKAEKDLFKYSILDGLQLAYKVTANSLYGQMGASTSKIYKKAIAASTTAGGRECIYRAKDYCLKNNPGCEVVYGDSVPAWELLHIEVNGKSIINNVKWIKETYFKFNNDDKSGKYYYLPKEEYKNKIFTFTETGKTPILNIMEHYSSNDIIKIITKAGTVHVTDEHSLILENGNIIKPKDLKLNSVLMTHQNVYSLGDLEYKGEVLEIINLGPTNELVYDLTTKNHHFQAGIGNLVVHNTDSVFVKFNLEYPDGTYPQTDKDKVQRSIDIGLELQQKLKDDKFFTPPHDLEYEKVFYPLMLITKKRYAGEKFEFEATKSKFTSMGIVLKRRDNAPILKHTYGGVMKKIMKEKNIESAIDFVKLCCQEIINDKYELNMFVISKTLRDYYKDPESIAHKVLADRMTERDPGNKPASNERIPYAYIKVEEKDGVKLLQGDKIEHVNYITEHQLELDYYIYIKNQLLKPICQIFELVVEDIKGYPYHPDHFVSIYEKYFEKYKGDKKKTEKKVSEEKQKVVAKLIFEEYLIKAEEKQNKTNNLNEWLVQIPDSGEVQIPKENKDIKKVKNETKRKPKKPKKQTNLDNFFT